MSKDHHKTLKYEHHADPEMGTVTCYVTHTDAEGDEFTASVQWWRAQDPVPEIDSQRRAARRELYKAFPHLKPAED